MRNPSWRRHPTRILRINDGVHDRKPGLAVLLAHGVRDLARNLPLLGVRKQVGLDPLTGVCAEFVVFFRVVLVEDWVELGEEGFREGSGWFGRHAEAYRWSTRGAASR